MIFVKYVIRLTPNTRIKCDRVSFGLKRNMKVAFGSKTIAFPIEPQLNLGDPRILLALLLVAITALLDAFLLKPARGMDD